MDSHVSVEVSRLREPQKTEVALIGLLSRVDPQVFGQSRAVGEGLLARAATVRPFARMRPHMSGHRR